MKIQSEMWMQKYSLSETGFWKYYSKAWVAPNDDPYPVKNKARLTELEGRTVDEVTVVGPSFDD